MYLSISYDNEELKNKIKAVLNNNAYSFLNVALRSKPYKQFEHYYYLVTTRYLAKHADIADRSWIAFIDDDDTIGTQRMNDYFTLIMKCAHDPVYPYLPPYVDIGSDLLPVTPAQQGIASKGYYKQPIESEYFTLCVYYPALLYFFQHASPSLLSHRFCDLFLSKYLHDEYGLKFPGLAPIQTGATPDNEYAYWARRDSDQARDKQKDAEHLEYILPRYIQSLYQTKEERGKPFQIDKFRSWYSNLHTNGIGKIEGIDMAQLKSLFAQLARSAPVAAASFKWTDQQINDILPTDSIQALLKCPSYMDWVEDEFLQSFDAIKKKIDNKNSTDNERRVYDRFIHSKITPQSIAAVKNEYYDKRK